MDRNYSILIIDDDAEMGTALALLLHREGYTVQAVGSAEAAEKLAHRVPRLRLLFIDLVMPAEDRMTLLECFKQQWPELAVIVTSGLGTLAAAGEAVRRGADDFITKPFEGAIVLKKVQDLLELQSLREEVAHMERTLQTMRYARVQSNQHPDRVSKAVPQFNDVSMFRLERLEKYAIEQALRISGNRKSRAVKLLGISRQTLYRKMYRHGIPV